jgi:hypothetical protein
VHLHKGFAATSICVNIYPNLEENPMSNRSDEIRDKYIKNPPEGMTADDIRHMSEDDLLDMDYFLNEDDEFGEDFPGAEGFYIF